MSGIRLSTVSYTHLDVYKRQDDEIELLPQSNLLVGRTLAEVAKLIKPGVTTKELDKVAEEFIRDNPRANARHA